MYECNILNLANIKDVMGDCDSTNGEVNMMTMYLANESH